MTLKEIEAGEGFFCSGEWTLIWQHGEENEFCTSSRSEHGAAEWHLAGGGRLRGEGNPEIEWCDLDNEWE